MNDGSYLKAFKRINRIRFLAIVICILVAFVSSCSLKRDLRRNKKTEEKETVTQTDNKTEEADETEKGEGKDFDNTSESQPGETAGGNIKIDLVITNSCKEDIGMIAILDPVTADQVNIGELPDGKLLSVSLDWPEDVTVLNMAVYNRNGDLVSESEIDITGVSQKVILSLSGDHNVENVDAKIE